MKLLTRLLLLCHQPAHCNRLQDTGAQCVWWCLDVVVTRHDMSTEREKERERCRRDRAEIERTKRL